MNIFLTMPVLFLAFLIQTSFLASFGLGSLRPDLVMLFIVAIGVVAGTGWALAWSLPAGLLLDFGDVTPLGAHLVGLLLVALSTTLRDAGVIEGKLTLALALSLSSTFLYGGAFLIMVQATGWRVEWVASLTSVLLPGAALNLAVMPVVYWVTKRLAAVPWATGAPESRP